MLLATPALAATPTPLPDLLDRVGRQVEKFWGYFPGVTCTEVLTQSKLDEKGKVLFEQRTAYDYLTLLQSTGDQIAVEESRMEKSRKASKGKAPLLVTNGFSILTLIFHPIYQSSYEFTSLQDAEGGLLRVAFRHHTARGRSPSVLLLRGREYPLEWSGVAWIDPSSGAVVRVQAGLGTSMEELGLRHLSSDVTYSATRFAGASSTYWLPVSAVIEATTAHQHWRNTHLFTGYRRFNVETEVRTTTPQ